MRLLHFNSSGNGFSLTEFVNEIPQYGILSHTWGPDSDEVTYKELVEGTGSGKAGYRKLKFCGDQAKKDQLQYFWVDTCCIDKSSAVELQEAITSMFRWYSEAAKCYVYLADVSTEGFDPAGSVELWEPAFRGSRWFTRGWTLQELIAPLSVEFFSADCRLLGDKKSLRRHIHEITGIPYPALEGSPLSGFSVADRMSWAEKRVTKREEDKAYSLLGIFGVYIPLIYGEGANAFRRLRKEIFADDCKCNPTIQSC